MKSYVFSGLCAVLTICGPWAAAQQLSPEQAQQVIARVGDEVITAGEYARELQLRVQAVQATTGKQANPDAAFRRALMTDMINGRVLSVASRNARVEVSDEEVEQEFQERKTRFVSEEEYQAYLEGLSITEDALKENIRSRLRVTRFVDGEAGELTATDEEIQAAYERLKAEGVMTRTEKTRDIAAILIRPEGDSDEDWREAEEEAGAVHDRLVAGEDFQEVAREVSDERATAERGGVLREMKYGSFFPELEAAMDAMEPGEVSEPVRSVMGWYIVTILEENEPGTIPLDKVREGVENDVIENKRKEIIAKIVEDAQKLMRIELVPAPGAPKELGGEGAGDNDNTGEGEETDATEEPKE